MSVKQMCLTEAYIFIMADGSLLSFVKGKKIQMMHVVACTGMDAGRKLEIFELMGTQSQTLKTMVQTKNVKRIDLVTIFSVNSTKLKFGECMEQRARKRPHREGCRDNVKFLLLALL
jgi:hypothetical protein